MLRPVWRVVEGVSHRGGSEWSAKSDSVYGDGDFECGRNSSDILPCAGPMSCQDSVRVVHVPKVHRGSDL